MKLDLFPTKCYCLFLQFIYSALEVHHLFCGLWGFFFQFCLSQSIIVRSFLGSNFVGCRCFISIPYLIEDESRLNTYFFVMRKVLECNKWEQMACFLYVDKFLIDFFVASQIILPYWATVVFKASAEDKTQARNPSIVQ